jgi:hypothetical protein
MVVMCSLRRCLKGKENNTSIPNYGNPETIKILDGPDNE